MLSLMTGSALAAVGGCLVLHLYEHTLFHGAPWQRRLGEVIEFAVLAGCVGLVVSVFGLALSGGVR